MQNNSNAGASILAWNVFSTSYLRYWRLLTNIRENFISIESLSIAELKGLKFLCCLRQNRLESTNTWKSFPSYGQERCPWLVWHREFRQNIRKLISGAGVFHLIFSKVRSVRSYNSVRELGYYLKKIPIRVYYLHV